jgi:uncharacterized membrane protein YgcG
MRQSSHTLTSATTLVIFAFCVTAKLTTAQAILPPEFVELIIYQVPESTLTVGHGINDQRDVVGYYQSPRTGGLRKGFLRTIFGFFFDLGSGDGFGGGGGTTGGGGASGQWAMVDNSGVVTGSFGTDPQVDDPNHGFIA